MIKMKYGILGTGEVARSIATKLIELGHEVMLGARCSTNEKAVPNTLEKFNFLKHEAIRK